MYERIVEDLKRRIGHGELGPGDRLPTIADMCQRYGVSRITVDHVVQALKEEQIVETFRGKGSFVKGTPRIDLADHEKVRVTSLAALWIGQTQFQEGFLGGIWSGITAEARERGLDLSTHHVPMNLTDIPLRTFTPAKGQGVIVLGGVVGAFEFALLANPTIPSVLVDGTTLGVECVATDNHEGVRQAVEHLAGLGHRRMAFYGGFNMPGNTTNENERREAFERLCADRGLETVLFEGAERRRMLAALKSSKPPTAFLFSRDEPARTFLADLKNGGVRVPQDVSVVSFDDYLADNEACGLTAVRVDRESMGRAAVKRLMEWHLEWPRPIRWTRIRPELIVRGSTGQAQGG